MRLISYAKLTEWFKIHNAKVRISNGSVFLYSDDCPGYEFDIHFFKFCGQKLNKEAVDYYYHEWLEEI